MKKPIISVIIPCYNQGKYIKETIDSVLMQTLQDFEIIIVNDGSTDNTANVLNSLSNPKLTIITKINGGVSSARNAGIRKAQGKYVLCLDSDDKIATTYIEKAIKILDANESIGIVYCLIDMFGAENKTWYLPEYSLKGMLNANQIFNAGIFRKESWEKSKGYDESMKLGEDWDFWLTIIEQSLQPYKINETLFFYRKHAESYTGTFRKLKKKEKAQKEMATYIKIIRNHPQLFIENIDVLIDKVSEFHAKKKK